MPTVFPEPDVAMPPLPNTFRIPATGAAVPELVGKLSAPWPPVTSRLILLTPLVIATVPPVEVILFHTGPVPPPISTWPLVPLLRLTVAT